MDCCRLTQQFANAREGRHQPHTLGRDPFPLQLGSQPDCDSGTQALTYQTDLLGAHALGLDKEVEDGAGVEDEACLGRRKLGGRRRVRKSAAEAEQSTLGERTRVKEGDTHR